MNSPKVLIVGQPFDKKGGGITLSNLFAKWNTENLAVVCSAQLLTDLNKSVCKNYYQLGEKEFTWMFPFNLIEKKFPSGFLNPDDKSYNPPNKEPVSYKPSLRRTFVDYIFYPVLKYSGLYQRRASSHLSVPLKEWIDEFKPEVLYVQFSGLDGILFAQKINSYLKIPMIVHMTDDWLPTVGEKGLFKKYWKKKVDKEFKKIIGQSNLLMSICEAMSEEYKIRYNREFIPFRNPINLDDWLPFSKKQWEIKNSFKVLYAGRIGIANGKSIMVMANAINNLNEKGIKLKLDIYSPDVNTKHAESLSSKVGVEVKKPVSHQEMPSLLPSYDLLFLPLDFDDDGIRFAQFSMPTKTSEYMISSTPILVFADRRTALTKYAQKYKWAYIVTENNREVLENALTELYSNLSLRENLAAIAKDTAIRIDDAEKVSTNFHKNFEIIL